MVPNSLHSAEVLVFCGHWATWGFAPAKKNSISLMCLIAQLRLREVIVSLNIITESEDLIII